MANYTKLTDFASKDSLPSGNAAKIVKGVEIDDEFNAIESAINSKAGTESLALTGTNTVPTATVGNNTAQIANTAFVTTAIANSVPSTIAAAEAAISDPSTNLVLNSTTLGSWRIEDNGSTILNIYYSGVKKFALDSSGNLTVTGNVTAYGTV